MYYETMERILSRVDTTIVEAPGVTPYLPLPELRRNPPPAGAAAGRGKDSSDEPASPATRSRSPSLAILALDPDRQHLRDRAGDAAGGDRPLRRAAARPQPLQAERDVRQQRRRPRRAHSVPRADRLDRQAHPVDRRLENQQVLSTDQLRLQVDAFARYRIVDPLQMYVSARTEENVTRRSCGRSSARRCATSSAGGRSRPCSAPSAAR